MSTVTKYVPGRREHGEPGGGQPGATGGRASSARSAASRRNVDVGQPEPDGDRRLERRAVHVGEELLRRAHRGRRSSGGAQTQPIFQPVHENVLPPDEIVTVRSRMPGNVASGTCAAVEHEVLVDLVGDGDEVVLDAQLRRSSSSSSRVKTLPVGLCGELSRSSRVRGVIARAQRVGVERRSRAAAACTRRPVRAGHRDARRVGVVVRLEGDDLVARLAQREQRRGDRLGGAGGDEHLGVGVVARGRTTARWCAAIAWRSSGMPGPGGYWLWPARMAATAASSTSGGPSVSGKPWPRLIEPVATASADISAKIVVPKPWSRDTRYGESATSTVDSASSSRSSEHSSASSPPLRSTPLRRPAHPSTPPLRLHLYGRLRFVVPLIRALLCFVSTSAGHEAQPHLTARVVAIEVDEHDALPDAQERLAVLHRHDQGGRDERGQHVIGAVAR